VTSSLGSNEGIIDALGGDSILTLKGPVPQPRQQQSLVQFFAQSPLAKVTIDLKRKRDFGRKIDLSLSSR
jgi:hypothetical protein